MMVIGEPVHSRILAFVCLLLLLAGVVSAQYAPFLNPHQQFFDNNGKPLAGGRISTYAAGTLNPLQTYSDINGTPNTNPIVLDSGGFATIYLANGSIYKFVASSSTGIQQWTQDNIASALTGTTLLGSFASPPPIGNVTPNTGQFTNINSTVMVTCPSCSDWGAAINAAIASCPIGYGSFRACKIVLPEVNSGPWATTATLPSPAISLVGQGGTATTFSCTVAGDCLYYYLGSSWTIQPGGVIQGFSIIGNGATGQNIIHMRDPIGYLLEDLYLDGANESGGACIWLEDYRYWTERNQFNHVRTGYNCTKSWRFSTDSGNTNCPTNGTSFCSFGYNRYLDIQGNPTGAGQYFWSVEGRSGVYNNTLRTTVNKSGTGAIVFNIQDYASLWGDEFHLFGEENGSGGYKWNVTANAQVNIIGGEDDLAVSSNNILGHFQQNINITGIGLPGNPAYSFSYGALTTIPNGSSPPPGSIWLNTQNGSISNSLSGLGGNMYWDGSLSKWVCAGDGANNGCGLLVNDYSLGKWHLFSFPRTGGATQTINPANVTLGNSNDVAQVDSGGNLNVAGTLTIGNSSSPVVSYASSNSIADGTLVVAVGLQLTGKYIIEFSGPNRQQQIVVEVQSSNFDPGSAFLNVLSNHAYSGQVVLTNPVIKLDASSVPQLQVTVGNRNGGTTVYVTRIGDGVNTETLLPAVAAGGTAVTTYGISWDSSGNETVNGNVSVNSLKIGGPNTAPVVATPTVGQAACIYAAGPPVQIGKCTSVVSAAGACTCAP